MSKVVIKRPVHAKAALDDCLVSILTMPLAPPSLLFLTTSSSFHLLSCCFLKHKELAARAPHLGSLMTQLWSPQKNSDFQSERSVTIFYDVSSVELLHMSHTLNCFQVNTCPAFSWDSSFWGKEKREAELFAQNSSARATQVFPGPFYD